MNVRTSSLLLGGVVVACASTQPASRVSADDPRVEAAVPALEAMMDGLAAARRGGFEPAVRALEGVARECRGTALGASARVALLGVLLDPRNPDRDPGRARRVAEAYLLSPGRPAWTEPVVEALYLIALDLGGASRPAGTEPVEQAPPVEAGPEVAEAGAEARAGGERPALEGCDADPPALAVAGAALPALPGRPLQERLEAALAEGAEWRDSASVLETRLAELEAELDRIRRALKP